jgi:hypothetical protein
MQRKRPHGCANVRTIIYYDIARVGTFDCYARATAAVALALRRRPIIVESNSLFTLPTEKKKNPEQIDVRKIRKVLNRTNTTVSVPSAE